MDQAKGLNGDPVFTVKDRFVGTVPGAPYGYKNPLRVTVGIRMEALTRQDAYETTEHVRTSRPLDFAITTAVWRPDGRDIVSGGATVEPLRELVTFARGFDADKARALAYLGERWHLNGTRAGCAHQAVVYEEDRYGRQAPSLDKTPVCRVDGAMELHPGRPEADGKPATLGGYRYGSAWLVEPLPDGFLDTLKGLLPPARQTS
jgi:hypothetical protein